MGSTATKTCCAWPDPAAPNRRHAERPPSGGLLFALDRGAEREFNPGRGPHHWGKRKLARDR
jgi:hypothetical protein